MLLNNCRRLLLFLHRYHYYCTILTIRNMKKTYVRERKLPWVTIIRISLAPHSHPEKIRWEFHDHRKKSFCPSVVVQQSPPTSTLTSNYHRSQKVKQQRMENFIKFQSQASKVRVLLTPAETIVSERKVFEYKSWLVVQVYSIFKYIFAKAKNLIRISTPLDAEVPEKGHLELNGSS